MNDSMERARQAAREKLLDLGCSFEQTPSLNSVGQATAAYIRSLIQDGDLGYLCELIGEHPDAWLLKRFSLLAQGIDSNHSADFAAIGAHEADGACSYLSKEIDQIISELPTWAELHADDYDEDYHRELRATT